MTLPRLRALIKQWRKLPPAPVQLARMAAFLGLPPAVAEPVERDAGEQIKQIQRLGVPVMDHLPDDPMLRFMTEDIGLGQSLPD